MVFMERRQWDLFRLESPLYHALDIIGNVWEWTADWYDKKQHTARWVGVSRTILHSTPARPTTTGTGQATTTAISVFVAPNSSSLQRNISGCDAACSTDGRTSIGSYARASWPGSALSMRARRAKKTAALRPVVAHAKPVGVFICCEEFLLLRSIREFLCLADRGRIRYRIVVGQRLRAGESNG